ncbi:hypothetical protein D3C81_1525300 [compost metagenome]
MFQKRIRSRSVIGVHFIRNEDDLHIGIGRLLRDELIGQLLAYRRKLLVFMGVIIEQEQIDHQKLPGFSNYLQNTGQNLLFVLLGPARDLIGKIMPKINAVRIDRTLIGKPCWKGLMGLVDHHPGQPEHKESNHPYDPFAAPVVRTFFPVKQRQVLTVDISRFRCLRRSGEVIWIHGFLLNVMRSKLAL